MNQWSTRSKSCFKITSRSSLRQILLARLINVYVKYLMIGKELRQIRVKLGLTQKLMAERLGLQRNTVARMERDEIGISGPVERLARLILDVQRLTSNMGFTERVLLPARRR